MGPADALGASVAVNTSSRFGSACGDIDLAVCSVLRSTRLDCVRTAKRDVPNNTALESAKLLAIRSISRRAAITAESSLFATAGKPPLARREPCDRSLPLPLLEAVSEINGPSPSEATG